MTRFLIVFGLLWLVLASSLRAGADAPHVRRADVVTLSQMCLGERSAREEHRDTCTAMIGVIHRRAAARGVRPATHARHYSAVFNGSRPWLLELNAHGTRPPSWPAASWTQRRPQWLALMRHVEGVLMGDVDPVCEDAWHFGSVDDGRNVPESWVRVCPDLDDRQLFWRVQ